MFEDQHSRVWVVRVVGRKICMRHTRGRWSCYHAQCHHRWSRWRVGWDRGHQWVSFVPSCETKDEAIKSFSMKRGECVTFFSRSKCSQFFFFSSVRMAELLWTLLPFVSFQAKNSKCFSLLVYQDVFTLLILMELFSNFMSDTLFNAST